jgi:hypothetical protein
LLLPDVHENAILDSRKVDCDCGASTGSRCNWAGDLNNPVVSSTYLLGSQIALVELSDEGTGKVVRGDRTMKGSLV